MSPGSEYVLESIRHSADFTLYRGQQRAATRRFWLWPSQPKSHRLRACGNSSMN